MNKEIETYRENAQKNGLCAEWAEKWDNCQSKKQYISMALSVKGMDYVCDTYAKGWGIASNVIYKSFNRFINGRYIYEGEGYTSKMYCLFRNKIIADTTAIILIDCVCDIEIPENHICEIYVTGKCELNISGKGRCVCICYGEESNIVINNECMNFKRINKKNRDGI